MEVIKAILWFFRGVPQTVGPHHDVRLGAPVVGTEGVDSPRQEAVGRGGKEEEREGGEKRRKEGEREGERERGGEEGRRGGREE